MKKRRRIIAQDPIFQSSPTSTRTTTNLIEWGSINFGEAVVCIKEAFSTVHNSLSWTDVWIYIVKRAQSANKGKNSALRYCKNNCESRSNKIATVWYKWWVNPGKAKGSILKNYRAIFEAITKRNDHCSFPK